MPGGRRSDLDEWWPYMRDTVKHHLQYETSLRAAAQKLVDEHGHRMPGRASRKSKVKMLEQRCHERLDELKLEIGPVPRTVVHTISVGSLQRVTFRITDRILRLIRKIPWGGAG
jgi:hypothetical protein